MSELRRDPIVDRWVIIAKDRAARPNEFVPPPPQRTSKPCPFCEGNEALTTAEIASIRNPGTQPHEPGWQVRVVPNRFPAYRLPLESSSSGGDRPGSTLLEGYLPAVGVQEVIIESPRHVTSTTDLNDAELANVLRIYRDRLLAIQKDPRIRYGLIFKNVGPTAGASIEHTHSQLVGMQTIPTLVAEELSAAERYFAEQGRCIFCDLVERELKQATRVVASTPAWVAFCPYAARFPFETWLMPRQHQTHFERISDAELTDLAGTLRKCIENIERASGGSQYNYLIHSSPFDTGPQSHYHWHIEIFPRMTTTAGFEWATGAFINPVPPEEAAKILCQH